MVNLQKLTHMEHQFCLADNYTNQIKRIELDSKNFNAIKDQLDGEFTKYMPTFWNSIVCEMWADGNGVRVVRENSTEEYDERRVNNTKWAGDYEDIKVKESVSNDMLEQIERKNERFNEQIKDEIESTMRIMAGLKS